VLLVADVMRRHVRVVKPDTTVRAAALQLLQFNIESLVVAEDGKPIGIVTERDILAAVMPRIDEIMAADGVRSLDLDDVARSHASHPVRDVMSRSLETTTPEVPVTRALGRMLANRMRRLPVLDRQSGELVGILTQRDLLGVLYLGAIQEPAPL
jgi:acetoin utilization protein AcuB